MKKTKDILSTTMLTGALVLQGALAEAQGGSNTATQSDGSIRPFRVHYPDSDLEELRRRIKATKWPKKETVTDGSQGVQLATIQKLANYWATDYDWRKAEARINSFPNFITNIDKNR